MLPSQTGVGESHFPSMHWLLFEPRNINPSSHQNWTLLWCWILSPNIKPFAGRVWGWHGAKRSKKKKQQQQSNYFDQATFFPVIFFVAFVTRNKSDITLAEFLWSYWLTIRHWNAFLSVFSSMTILLIMETNRRFRCSMVVYMYAIKHQRCRNCIFISPIHFIFKSDPFPCLHKLLSKLSFLKSWWLKKGEKKTNLVRRVFD